MMNRAKPAPLILLVDDEQGIRSLLRVVLQRNGYGVLEANNGSEALALFDKHQPDIALLLTDVMMPGIGGIELARQVAMKRPDVPVVLFRRSVSQFRKT